MRVAELMNEQNNEYQLELACSRLRVYELARFKQFRRSMLERLRPRMGARTSPRLAAIRESLAADTSTSAAASNSLAPPATSTSAAATTAAGSVDLNIDGRRASVLRATARAFSSHKSRNGPLHFARNTVERRRFCAGVVRRLAARDAKTRLGSRPQTFRVDDERPVDYASSGGARCALRRVTDACRFQISTPNFSTRPAKRICPPTYGKHSAIFLRRRSRQRAASTTNRFMLLLS